jgi:di/tricarboxylate transporter/CRP-like cAMP-binding protein
LSELPDAIAGAQALAAVPMFAGLPPVDLAKVAGVLEERWYDAGSTVFEAGVEGDGLYILREGLAQRRVSGSPVSDIRPLEAFGQLSLLTDERRSASVVSVTAIRVWVIPRQRFYPLLHGEPELMMKLTSAIGLELAQTRQALGALQRELDGWVAERLAELEVPDRDVVEAAALLERAPLEVLARFAGVAPATLARRLDAISMATPMLDAAVGGYRVPEAVRAALLRRLDAEHRRASLAARLRVAQADPAAGSGGAGSAAALAADPVTAEPAVTAPTGSDSVAAPKRFKPKQLAGFVLAGLVLALWMNVPPEGLSVAGWRALLTVIAAAILFASEALPDEVVALALLASWVVGGVVPPRVALEGFATQPWVLVLAVLAVGVAVGNTGLMYRLALGALGRKPAGFANRCMTLALVGTAVTPTLPNATSRTALAAPMVREVAEALGYQAGSREATGLAMAGLLGFGQMAGLFLTGSSVGVLVHGLLPVPLRTEFGFLDWFIAALPMHVVMFAGAMVAIVLLYRPRGAIVVSGDRLALQRAVLGPMRRDEKLCLMVMVGMIGGFLTESIHGVNGAWVGVAALAALAAGRALDTTMIRNGVNWPFLIFFGAISSLAAVFGSLKVDVWLASRLSGPIEAMAGSGLLFCLALALIGFALAFVVRWQAAAPLLTLVALPAATAVGVHPFLVALISLVATQVWFLPYQSTVYLALYHGSGECFTHAQARVLAWLWGPLVLVSIVCAWPVWHAMGLIR